MSPLRPWPSQRDPLREMLGRVSDRLQRMRLRTTSSGNRSASIGRDAAAASAIKAQGTILLQHRSERSLLQSDAAASLTPFIVAGRSRLATCSGVAWLGDRHLAVVNLYGGHLRIYRLHLPDSPSAAAGERGARLELLHEMSEGLAFPEDVAASRDGRLLAVTSSVADSAGVSLHRIDPATLNSSPAGETIRRGKAFHGLTFSPDSRYLAFTEIGRPGFVEVVSLAGTVSQRRCLLVNPHSPLKPKAVSFSSDGRFAAISLSLNVTPADGPFAVRGMLSVHAFDAAKGIIASEPLDELRDAGMQLGSVEICKFVPGRPGGPYRILAANQGADCISIFRFDAAARRLSFAGICAAGLSFPHGLDVSPDGRLVAVACYGDDTLTICSLAEEPPEGSAQRSM